MDLTLLESFALAEDRAQAASRALPGTEEEQLLQTLLHQQRGELAEARRRLDHPGQRRRFHQPLLLRQLLLEATAGEPRGWSELQRGERFDHRCNLPGQTPPLPSRLLPAQTQPQALLRQHVSRSEPDLDALTQAGLDHLLQTRELGASTRKKALQLLSCIRTPRQFALLVEDLSGKPEKHFGNLAVHRRLTLAQLEELARRFPALLGSDRFVETWLQRTEQDPLAPREEEPTLARLLALAERLPDAQRSRKAGLSLRRLRHRWLLGEADRPALLRYLELTAPDFRDTRARCAPSGSDQDEALLLAVLRRCLGEDGNTGAFRHLLSDTFLQRQLAEHQLLSGAPDPQRWASLLGPEQLRALQQRVDLELAPENPTHLAPHDPVTLLLDLKNLEALNIRIFHVDAAAHYRATGREVDVTLDLDGFVPNQERRVVLQKPPMLRHRLAVPLPELTDPGTYLIDVVGGGLSCRALLRKGSLRALDRVTAAGLELLLVDEGGEPVAGGTAWLQGQAFEASPDGVITLPFTTTPGRRSVVLQQGKRAALQELDLPEESYELQASFHVEREDLLPGAEARLMVQARLRVAGAQASLSLLQRPRLTLAATSGGTPSERSYDPIQLDPERPTWLPFTVPERLEALSFTLSAEVLDLQGVPRTLQATSSIQGPSCRSTERIHGLYLHDTPEGWALQALGRNGEPLPGALITLELESHLVKERHPFSLQTDDEGLLFLGPLPHMRSLQASLPGGEPFAWNLHRSTALLPGRLELRAGAPLELALDEGSLAPGAVPGLFVTDAEGTIFHELHEKVRHEPGYLRIEGLEAGHYRLVLPLSHEHWIALAVSEPRSLAGWRVEGGQARRAWPPAPPRMTLEVREGALRIQVHGASRRARLLVIGTTLVHPFPGLLPPPSRPAQERRMERLPSVYTPPRALGDEARYILARRGAPRRAGNMLPAPSLLLNPWTVGDTSTATEQLKGGESHRMSGAYAGAAAAYPDTEGGTHLTLEEPFLDFLGAPALILPDLELDEAGTRILPVECLGGRGVVRVVLLDGEHLVGAQCAVSHPSLPLRDGRIKAELDPTLSWALQGEALALQTGDSRRIQGSTFRLYDTLLKAWSLLEALDTTHRCVRIDALKRWPSLSEEEKLRAYSEHACSELHFFLYSKDRPFFDRVIRPYLANKRHRTFLDRYLLQEDLSGYRDPALFARLNALERVLLSRHLGEQRDEGEALQAWKSRYGTSWQREEYLFRAALRADALSEEPSLEAAEPVPSPEVPARERSRGGGGPRKKTAPRASRSSVAKEEAEEQVEASLEDFLDEDLLAQDALRRVDTRQLYRPLDRTRELAEQHYWGQRVLTPASAIAPLNPFWVDYARHEGPGPFLSPNFLHCTDGSAAMLLALAVLDLPWEAPAHEFHRAPDGALLFRAAGPALLFHEHLQKAPAADDLPPLLLLQHYLDGASGTAPVAGEFLIGRAYQGQILISNPTATSLEVDLLSQPPPGALPLGNQEPLRSERLSLGPYETRTITYSFYFPRPGVFEHLPAQVSRHGKALAGAGRQTLRVVPTPSHVDTDAWAHLSQAGDPEAVLQALATRDLSTDELELIAWRMQDRGFYERALTTLERRRRYHPTLWAYALWHRDRPRAATYLRLRGLDSDMMALEVPWLPVDPQDEGSYEHLEYAPLMNPRAHGAAGSQKILNDRLAAQVERFLVYLCSKGRPTQEDRLAIVYYWLLQDRVDEARALFEAIDPSQLRGRLQYDYVSAYLAFFEDPARARVLALRHQEHPVDRWRNRFREILAQLDEIEGHAALATDPQDRDQRQGQLAATAPSLELRAEAGGLALHHRHAPRCQLRFYEMDLELLFSQRPFGLQTFRQRPVMQPNLEQPLDLGPGEGVHRIELPHHLRSKPALIEVTCGEARATIARTEASFVVQLSEGHGQLRVVLASNGAPLPRVYVKVYAQDVGGAVLFHKDGYTDLRGRFDYASVSGGAASPTRFALLLLDDVHGAALREVNAPVR
jgi:hypothetical protein